MKMEFDLNLQQTQKLIMTPELKQAIEILQLNAFELNNLVENEIETNPLLEKEESIEEVDIIELTKYIQRDQYNIYNTDSDDDEVEDTYENYISSKPSLIDHLMFQLHVTPIDIKLKKICEYIIYSLNSNGYLKDSTMDIAKALKCDEKYVIDALNIVQGFDPAGVGARNLKECLKLQLISKGEFNGLIKDIIEYHLNEIAENKFAYISKLYNVSIKEIQNIVDKIKSLNPKPGSNFYTANDVKYITPDVYVLKDNDDYIVLVNDSLLPRLKINSQYQKILNGLVDDDVKNYISSKLQSAFWLIKSIESRRETLYKVVKAIVEVQKGFFDEGINFLKPMIQKHIAEMIDMHESTVSRAINGKYVDTPRGLFEIKYFFQSGISNSNGYELSSESIKNLIKKLIEDENPQKPLSDQTIADILKEKNINISRRTVTKYREECKIPSTVKRKRY